MKNKNIYAYFNMMEKMLNSDLLQKIYTEICLDIIRKQKKNKQLLIKDINKFFRTCYKDNKILIYINELNQLIMQNITYNNIQLYHHNDIETYNLIENNSPETIISNNINSEDDDTDILRTINISIMYV
jgi:hypothetical protein